MSDSEHFSTGAFSLAAGEAGEVGDAWQPVAKRPTAIAIALGNPFFATD
jgi:hypothetical protein